VRSLGFQFLIKGYGVISVYLFKTLNTFNSSLKDTASPVRVDSPWLALSIPH